MDSGNEKIQEEMREVQKEVEDAEEKVGTHSPISARRLEDAEEGSSTSYPPADSGNGHRLLTRGESVKKQKSLKEGLVNLVQLFVNPILVQTFVMTFLAEWGDRSQISTIALAAAHVRRFLISRKPSLTKFNSLSFLIECLDSDGRNRSRPSNVHVCRSNGRSLASDKNLSKTCHAWRSSALPHIRHCILVRGKLLVWLSLICLS